MLLVVRDVPRKLVGPKCPVALGSRGSLAALVPVPETPMDEDHRPMPRQNDVGLAGEILHMQPEPVPRAVEQAADQPLRDGVLAPDPRHSLATFSLGERIRHDWELTFTKA